MFLKLCGMKRPQDIGYVNRYLPDFIGFVFAKSPRRVTAEQAAVLSAGLNPEIRKAGVFFNEELDVVIQTAKTVRLSVIQLHGEEDASYISGIRSALPGIIIWKTVHFTNPEDLIVAEKTGADALLIDAVVPGLPGGSGQKADWDLLKKYRDQMGIPFILAGGITADNLLQAGRLLSPDGFDLCSGTETGGVKDERKIRKVIEIFAKYKRDLGIL